MKAEMRGYEGEYTLVVRMNSTMPVHLFWHPEINAWANGQGEDDIACTIPKAVMDALLDEPNTMQTLPDDANDRDDQTRSLPSSETGD
ncbi:hypothetical protein CHU98_g11880 [Xylaria longipes]|nr:hypothetical protein CHU98_g11880 [Xylaria longipes]